MTIDSQYIGEQFNPIAAPNSDYVFGFEVLEASDVEVVYQYPGSLLTYVDPADYSVALSPPSAGEAIHPGGTVTLTPQPPADVEKISIIRTTEITQLVDYQPYSPFPAESTEFAFDKLTMISQEQGAEIGFLRLQVDGLLPTANTFGTVDDDGTILGGSNDFSVERLQAGQYEITFVTAAATTYGHAIVCQVGVLFLGFAALIGGQSANSVQVNIINDAGALTDAAFSFIRQL